MTPRGGQMWPRQHRYTRWCRGGKYGGIGLVLCLLVVGVVASQPASTVSPPLVQYKTLDAAQLMVTEDRASLGPGVRCTLTLSLEVPAAARVTFPEVSGKLGALQVIQQHGPDSVTLNAQRRRWQQEYTLEAGLVGAQVLPPLTVSWQEGDTAPQQLTTDPLTVTVTSRLPAGTGITEIQDITPPVALPMPGGVLWPWLVGGGVVCGACIAGLWWYTRTRQPERLPVPPQPAHVLALGALQRLQRDDLPAQQRYEEFYVRLSAIVRHYVEWRFRVRAPEQTTEEFLAMVLQTGGLVVSHCALLDTFLQQCDLVKFARYQPTPDDMQQAFTSAKNFVEHTADAQVLVSATLAESVPL